MSIPARAKEWAGRVALVGGSVLVALLLVESALRLFSPVEFRVRGDEITLPANVSVTYYPGHPDLEPSVTVRRNRLGLRGPELVDRTGRGLSILTVGGSTTESSYFRHERSWPGQLAARLSENFGSVWLNNAGLDGHSTFGHVVLLRDHLVALNPDVIVFLIGVNDIGLDRPQRFDRDQVNSLGLSSPKQFVRSLAKFSDVAALTLNGWRTFAAWRQGLLRGQTPSVNVGDASTRRALPPSPARVQELTRSELLEGFASRIFELIALCDRNGIYPIVVTQPFVAADRQVDRTYEGMSGLTAAENWHVLEAYNDVTRSVVGARNASLVDLASLMPHRRAYFTDLIHFSQAGANEVARLLYAKLCSILAAEFPGELRVACQGNAGSLKPFP